MIRKLLLAPLAALGMCAAAASAATYNYLDTTFVNPDWIGVKLVDTSTPAASFAAFQVNAGGSTLPGPQTADYRSIRHSYGGGSGGGAIVVSHEGTNFDWNPLPLEVAVSADYTYDLNFFDGPAGAVAFSPAIFQGGNVYRLPVDQIFGPQSGWQRFGSSSIPIATFQQIDTATGLLLAGTPNPTAAMSFGFVSANSANGPSVKISGLDDYGFTLNTILVPEPMSGAFMMVIAAGAVAMRRRRSR